MRSAHVRRAAAAGAALAALVACAGCQDSGGADEPTATSSEASTDPSAASESPSGSESPSDAAATGVEVAFGGVSLHAPEGWRKAGPRDLIIVATFQKGAVDPQAVSSNISLTSPTALNPDLTLDEQAQGSIDTQRGSSNLKQADPVTLDGVEFYHLEGRSDTKDIWVYEYGAQVGGRAATIAFDLDRWTYPDKAERDQLVASVLASVQIDDSAG
jgi:hypothetical protein